MGVRPWTCGLLCISGSWWVASPWSYGVWDTACEEWVHWEDKRTAAMDAVFQTQVPRVARARGCVGDPVFCTNRQSLFPSVLRETRRGGLALSHQTTGWEL